MQLAEKPIVQKGFTRNPFLCRIGTRDSSDPLWGDLDYLAFSFCPGSYEGYCVMVRFVYVEKRLSAEGELEIVSSLFFNGLARRAGARIERQEYELGDSLDHRLAISMNVHEMPALFSPMRSWVVREDVRRQLAGIANIEFLEVGFEKLIDVPYVVGDTRWQDIDGDSDLFELFEADSRLFPLEYRYYELIVPSYQRIRESMHLTSPPVFLTVEDSTKPEEIVIEQQLLDRFPIFRYGIVMYLSEVVFSKIKAFIDTRFFKCSIAEAPSK